MAFRGWRTVAVAAGAAGALAAAGAVQAMPAVSALTATSTASPAPRETFDDTLRSAPLKRTPRVFTARRPLRMLVVGDSVSRTLAEGIRPLAGRYHVVVIDRGLNGCGISLGSPFRYFGNVQHDPPMCRAWVQRWRQAVQRDRPDLVMLLVGRWELMDRVHNGRWTHIGQAGYDAYLLAQLTRAIDVVSSRGARVVLVTPPYFRRGLRPDGRLWPEDDVARVDRWDALVKQAASGRPDVSVADLTSKLGRGAYREIVGGVRLRYDGVHLTPQAGRLVGPWLLRKVLVAAR